MRKPTTAREALMRLEDLCSRAEHCTGEVREKLHRWGIGASDADKIVKQLIASRFVDDNRFARAYVRDKYRFAHWGRRKIAMQLAAKRLPRDIVNNAVDETIDPQEYSNILLHLIQMRGERLGKPDEDGQRLRDIDTYDGRTRLYRFALARGFESDLISRAIRALVSGQ